MARQSLQNQKNKLAQSKKDAPAQFAAAQKEIEKNEAALADAKTALAAAQDALTKAKAEYASKIQEAQDSFTTAEAKISDLRKRIANMSVAQWQILTREDGDDYSSFGSDAKRVDALSTVFPISFYLIAALVCLTTLTRMVEDHRTQIGIFRALGYSKVAIASKYLIYAVTASLLGCTTGLLVGQFVFPYLIYGAYASTYAIPSLIVPFDTMIALVACLSAVLINTLTAIWACYYEISAVPAELIRPKAPLPGHRVLLERIRFIWNRLSFLAKVTIRNLLRFKKRFFMTIIGVAGCTALILTGFGLRDSIAGTLPKQYYGLHSYHLFINLITPSNSTDASKLNETLSNLLDDWLYVTQTKVEIQGLDKTMTTYLFVPEDTEKAASFVNFRNRVTGESVTFPEPGKVILTEKIALKLGAKVGSTITLWRNDNKPVQVQVGAVTENYVYNYVFMTPEDYTSLFGSAPEYTMVLGKAPHGENITEAEETKLTTELLKQDNVLSATTIASIRRQFDVSMQNLDAVVLVIIICACLLNFVVLFNLANINITERTREIATIKVLGFYNRETWSYINREIIILTLIGALLGLAGGVWLHRFTIETAEVDIMMYVRDIKPLSYVWSIFLTMFFSSFINLVIQFRLRRIKMVESLKSIE